MKYPVAGLDDFGHVFSNVSYILSGVIFVVITLVRSKRYKVRLIISGYMIKIM